MSKLSAPITETVLIVNTQSFAGISRIQPHTAGMDSGAHEIWVCVPGKETDTQIIRLFGTYTADLHAIGNWLQEHQIQTIAMGSTGVYWIPIFEYLESLGFQCCLISSRSIKRVPGRKSDVEDCQWIQTLHSYGLRCAFGAFYRRKKSQLGPAQAIVATAHMIARTVYFMLKNQVQYSHVSAQSFDKRYREQQIRYLHRKAANLGFQLIPTGVPPLAVS